MQPNPQETEEILNGKLHVCAKGNKFYAADLLSFNYDFARNVVIFRVDNTSSSRTDSRKNNF